MKKYDKYIRTSLAGINEVPHHWKPIKLKFIGNLFSGLSGKSGDDFYYPENPLSRPYISFKNIAGNSTINPTQLDYVIINPDDVQNQVKKGDLFFLMSSENFEDIGKTAVLEADLEETYLNSFCRGFRINDNSFSPSFLNYLLSSGLYRQMMSIEAKGFTRINIQVGKIQNFQIFAPFSLEEQTKIVQYLDHQTTIIDQLIQQKEKLIELLKEKRQAVINEAVTKGLNPNAKMKDSGIEWLGEVPKQWNLVQIRHLNTKVGSGVTPKGGAEVYTEEGVIFIRSQNVHFDGLRLDDVVKIDFDTHEKMSSSKVMYKDVLLNITGASIGRCCVVEKKNEMNVNQHVCIIRPTPKILPEYLNLVLQSNVGQVQIKLGTTGGNREGLTFEAIKEFVIPLPDLKEQEEILNTIQSSLNRYYELESLNSIQIYKMKEYRQSVISEAVTGKIDVRDWQPNKQQVA